MKLIVGLGNPGPKYAGTRHNIGFNVIDLLSSRWSIDVSGEKFHGWFGLGTIGPEKVGLLKPAMYMNRSGQSVQAAGRFYKLDVQDLLVVSDDFALPLGRIRMRASGSAGGHNGLQDIVDRLGGENWSRLRVGIDEPIGDSPGHVLGRFAPGEMILVERVCRRAADAVECWVLEGVDAAMTKFNGGVPAE